MATTEEAAPPAPRAAPGVSAPRRSAARWRLASLLLLTLVAYVWRLDQNGWGNPFYAAAAQAAAQDWKAFFYGSMDWNNLITVDKPPLSIWPVALSVRLFGLSPWSVLVPQALMGVGTVWLLYAAVRRLFAERVALTVAILFAAAPAMFLMSRFNNPEPSMGLLVGVALYAAVRAAQDPLWRWYLLCGIAFGLAFLSKQFQALVPVPAVGISLLLLGSGHWLQRMMRLGGSFAAMVLAGGWWIAGVDLTPASDRPYIGGSVTNSALELTMDYNGLARFLRFDAQGPGPSAAAQGGPPVYDGGLGRLFNANFAPEGAWLLATAAASVIILAVYSRVLGRGAQQMLVLAGCAWFLTGALLLSYMGTMVHTYYVYSLAAPTAVVMGLALEAVWRRASTLVGRLFGVFLLGSTALIGVRIMQYSDFWGLWGPGLIIALAAVASVMWLVKSRPLPAAVWIATVLSLTSGQMATDAVTASAPIQGTNPMSGPVSVNPNALTNLLSTVKATGTPEWAPHVAFGVAPSARTLAAVSSVPSDARWAAATFPAQDASLLQLETRRPVLALGGWLGLDPAPSFPEFQRLVANGEIQLFIDRPSVRERGVGPDLDEISAWVRKNFRGEDMSDGVIYHLDSAHRQ